MSFAGSSASMNTTIRNNRNLLKRKSAFETRVEMGFNTKKGKAYRFKKATSKQLSSIRAKIIQQQRLGLMIRMILLFSITCAVGCILYIALIGTINI